MALFPEMCAPENAEDTDVKGYLPPGHIDRGGDIYGNPIPGHCQIGAGGMECVMFPEGVLGKPSLADPKKAIPSIEKFMDYIVKLHDDILERFPVGQLPPANEMSQRDPKLMEDILKGPTKGGKHLYTLGFPS